MFNWIKVLFCKEVKEPIQEPVKKDRDEKGRFIKGNTIWKMKGKKNAV